MPSWLAIYLSAGAFIWIVTNTLAGDIGAERRKYPAWTNYLSAAIIVVGWPVCLLRMLMEHDT